MVNSSVAVVVLLLLFNDIIFVGDAVSAAVVDVNDYATVIVVENAKIFLGNGVKQNCLYSWLVLLLVLLLLLFFFFLIMMMLLLLLLATDY